MNIPRLRFGFGHLDGNHHGCDASGKWDRSTLRSTWSIVPLGRYGWVRSEGRRRFGRRLWIYDRTGVCVCFDVTIVFKRSPCRPGSKYAPQGDPRDDNVVKGD